MLSFIIFSLFFPTALAAENGILINEIYAPGTPDWVELYNPSNEEIDITNWKLLDNSTTPIKTFSQGTTIGPNAFFVIEVSNRLNNSGDHVKLVDQNGTQLNQFEYTTISENKSFARIPDGSGSWFGNRNPTKGTTNGSVPPKSDPTEKLRTGKIILSEFMPNPDGGKE